MMAMIGDALQDAAIDTIKLIPFLFVTYLVMEALERKTSDHTTNLIANVGRFGPVAGALVGIVPQCGKPLLRRPHLGRNAPCGVPFDLR